MFVCLHAASDHITTSEAHVFATIANRWFLLARDDRSAFLPPIAGVLYL